MGLGGGGEVRGEARARCEGKERCEDARGTALRYDITPRGQRNSEQQQGSEEL